ncbi:MAG TPA: hypothetical protein VNJ07_12200, partial [Chitinophagales bacterium]|nr:hypothetical protein [Chitinophagales bacterium]
MPFLFLAIPARSQNINVFHSIQPLPSPYVSDWELDPTLTFMQITSFSQDATQITARVIVTEQSLGVILTGNSIPIDVSEGAWSLRINNTEFVNWDDVDYSESVEQTIQRTGRIPDGNYTICSYVLSFPDDIELAHDCKNFTVVHPQPPMLIYPTAGMAVENPYPTFHWTPVQWFGQITYLVTISEVLQNQQPQEAVTLNVPHLSMQVDGQTTLPYDITLPSLEAGKHYAWKVQALDHMGHPVGQNGGNSEVESFYFQFNAATPYIEALSPGNDCSGSVTTSITTSSVTFSWMANGTFSEYYVVCCPNPCGKYPPGTPTTPGGRPTPTTATGGRPTTTTTASGLVPGRASNPTNTGTQTTTGGITAVNITDHVSGKQNTVLSNSISQALGTVDPALGDFLYISPPIQTGGDYHQKPGRPSSHSVTLNLTGVIEPGAAFTYFICGTELASNTVVFSQTKCDRYSPPTTTGETPPEVPCPQTPICQIEIKEEMEPLMDGGLTPFSKTITEMNRDDFIPLEAEGRDFDRVIWKCIPSDNCNETPSERKAPLTGRVKFMWEIMEGEGSFKKLGCLPDDLKSEEGEHVIFQPPYVELPKDDTPKKKVTKIKLKIIDDNPTQPADSTVERIVTIETTRKKASPNKYFIKIISDAYKLPAPPPEEKKMGTCKASDPEWKNNDDFAKPSIELPPVADNDKMVVGEMMLLKVADQHEKDEFKVKCISQLCTSTEEKKLYEDDVEFRWKILSGSGKILGAAKGRTIIYQATMSMPESRDKELIKIECEVVNPFGLQIVDKPRKGEITFYVHNAGVKVSHPPGTWLPTDDNDVELISSLKYKSGS